MHKGENVQHVTTHDHNNLSIGPSKKANRKQAMCKNTHNETTVPSSPIQTILSALESHQILLIKSSRA